MSREKALKHGIELAEALNAKVVVIAVTEPLPVDYGPGHALGWIPTREEVDSFNAGRKAFAGRVLDDGRSMAEQIGTTAELLHIPDAH